MKDIPIISLRRPFELSHYVWFYKHCVLMHLYFHTLTILYIMGQCVNIKHSRVIDRGQPGRYEGI